MRPVVKQTFREQIVQELRASVLNGTLSPGSPVVEADLALKFGVSRGPLREALRHLIEEGLLVTKPYTGTHVAALSLQDIQEIFSLRVELEIFAFRLIWDRRDQAFINEFKRRHDVLLDRISAGDSEGCLIAELALHSFPYEASGHKLLLTTWVGLKSRLQLYWATYNRARGRMGPAPEHHVRYVELAAGSSFDDMATEVRAHMLHGFETMEEFMTFQEDVARRTQLAQRFA